jgi:hypothetical protein
MIACIHRAAATSYCGRTIPDEEFRFTDGPHAAQHYDFRDNKKLTLIACAECVDGVRAHEAKR